MRIEEVLPLVSQLSTEDKLRLIDLLAKQLLEEQLQAGRGDTHRMYALLIDQEQDSSQEEIPKPRREIRSKFPRD
jgi:hypothetical protein